MTMKRKVFSGLLLAFRHVGRKTIFWVFSLSIFLWSEGSLKQRWVPLKTVKCVYNELLMLILLKYFTWNLHLHLNTNFPPFQVNGDANPFWKRWCHSSSCPSNCYEWPACSRFIDLHSNKPQATVKNNTRCSWIDCVLFAKWKRPEWFSNLLFLYLILFQPYHAALCCKVTQSCCSTQVVYPHRLFTSHVLHLHLR